MDRDSAVGTATRIVECLDNTTTRNINRSKMPSPFILKTRTPHYIHTTFRQPEDESSNFRNVVYIVWCTCF
jgi:hypothetical protein